MVQKAKKQSIALLLGICVVCVALSFTPSYANLVLAPGDFSSDSSESYDPEYELDDKNLLAGMSYTVGGDSTPKDAGTAGGDTIPGSLLTDGVIRSIEEMDTTGAPVSEKTLEFVGTYKVTSFTFEFDEAVDIATIVADGARGWDYETNSAGDYASNRHCNIAMIEISYDGLSYTEVGFKTSRVAIDGTGKYGIVQPENQFWTIRANFTNAAIGVLGLRVTLDTTRTDRTNAYVLQLDELEAYAPTSSNDSSVPKDESDDDMLEISENSAVFEYSESSVFDYYSRYEETSIFDDLEYSIVDEYSNIDETSIFDEYSTVDPIDPDVSNMIDGRDNGSILLGISYTYTNNDGANYEEVLNNKNASDLNYTVLNDGFYRDIPLLNESGMYTIYGGGVEYYGSYRSHTLTFKLQNAYKIDKMIFRRILRANNRYLNIAKIEINGNIVDFAETIYPIEGASKSRTGNDQYFDVMCTFDGIVGSTIAITINTEFDPSEKDKYSQSLNRGYICGLDEIEAYGVIDTSEDVILINENNFPDESFRNWISQNLDMNSNGSLSKGEISAATRLDVSDSEICNLKGIEFFTELIYLDCSFNNLVELNISNNLLLEYLDCSVNGFFSFKELNVSNNINLTTLKCTENNILELDLSNNIKLEYLDCSYNSNIASLDLSNNIALKYLNLSNSEKVHGRGLLRTIDLSNCAILEEFYCGGNDIDELDLSNCTMLETLSCSNNRIRKLDVSKNKALKHLYCSDNMLTVLELDENDSIITLYCQNNNITSLDISHCKNISYFYAGGNSFTVTVKGDTFDTSTLPGKFNRSNVVSCEGGTIDSNGMIYLPSTSDTFSYLYKVSETETVEFQLIIVHKYDLGDANGDNKINAQDAANILQYDVKVITVLKYIRGADVNDDGKINAQDASLILMYDVKLIDKFPVIGGSHDDTNNSTNYALNSTYEIRKNGIVDSAYNMFLGGWEDSECSLLNDGIVGRGYELDENGALEGVSVQMIGTAALFEISFALDDYYTDISTIVFKNVRNGEAYGNNRTFDTEIFPMIFVSDDGINWSLASGKCDEGVPINGAPLIKSADNDTYNVENFDYTFTFDEVQKAKYINIMISSNDFALQLDEIEIRN